MGTLWPCSTVTRNVPDVGRKGWETIPVLRSLNARFVRHSHLLKYNNWPPQPTSPGKNVESRRRRQNVPVVLPPLSWTLKTLGRMGGTDVGRMDGCWDGYTQMSRLQLNRPLPRRRGVLRALLNPARGNTAVNLLLMTTRIWIISGVRGFHDLKLCFLLSCLLCRWNL